MKKIFLFTALAFALSVNAQTPEPPLVVGGYNKIIDTSAEFGFILKETSVTNLICYQNVENVGSILLINTCELQTDWSGGFLYKIILSDLKPKTNYSLTYHISNSGGSTDTTTIPFTTESTVSSISSLTEEDWSVTNPVSNTLVVTSTQKSGVITIANLAGQIVLKENITNSTNQFDATHIPSGIYIANVNGNLKKIFKE